MAFGSSVKFTQEYPLNGMDQQQLLALMIESMNQLGWKVENANQSRLEAYTKMSWTSWSERITITFSEGNAIVKSECTDKQVIDWGKHKKNVDKLIKTFESVKPNINPERLNQALSLIQESPEEGSFNSGGQHEEVTEDRGFLALILPGKDYLITPIILFANILVFVLMLFAGVHVMTPDSQSLLDWGANFRPLTMEGEWWRLLTSVFVHIGVLHLLLNMYALVYVGIMLEPILGKARFLSAYLITGIASSVASLMWHDFTISAGASGAVFGMYGVFLALLTTNFLPSSVKNTMMASIAVFVGYNLLYGLQPNSGIDNAAHVGGLISGMLIGYSFLPGLKNPSNSSLKYGVIGVLSLALIVFTYNALKSTPNDIATYESGMKEFADYEQKALEVFNLTDDAPREAFLTSIKDHGLNYWHESEKIVNGFDVLNLPEHIRNTNEKLKEYLKLRIQSYELLYKAIDEDSNQYDSSIAECTKKIEAIINDMSAKQ